MFLVRSFPPRCSQFSAILSSPARPTASPYTMNQFFKYRSMDYGVKVLSLISFLFLANSICGKEAPSLESVWKKASAFSFAQAFDELELLKREQSTDQREFTFCEAVLLMNQQPKTQKNLTKAHSLFLKVIESDAHDDLGIQSRYFDARITEIHQRDPDPVTARAVLFAISQEHPDHYFGQLAYIKYVSSALFDADSIDEVRKNFETVESQSAIVSIPELKVIFHRNLAEGYTLTKYSRTKALSKEKALRHYLMAWNTGLHQRRSIRSNMLIRIGELAFELGEYDVAGEAFRHFLREFPRDQRAYMVSLRLKGMRISTP